MTRFAKDCLALGATLLAVLTFMAADGSWNVPLVGDNAHWAGAVMLGFGMVACTLGDPEQMTGHTMLMPILGAIALVLAIVGIVTGSLTVLALLAVNVTLLWTVATLNHVHADSARTHAPHAR